MADQTTTAPESASLQITREQAELILEAVKMLCNSRRYAFKDQHDDIEQVHSSLFDSASDLEQRLRDAFSER